MDWISLVSAVGINTLAMAVITGIQNRRINKAAANNSNADYAQKVIAQADERVAQAISDRERAISERDAAYAESKGQRTAKREWRDKFYAMQDANHELELKNHSLVSSLNEANWHKCEVNGCIKRTPPRKMDTA